MIREAKCGNIGGIRLELDGESDKQMYPSLGIVPAKIAVRMDEEYC